MNTHQKSYLIIITQVFLLEFRRMILQETEFVQFFFYDFHCVFWNILVLKKKDKTHKIFKHIRNSTLLRQLTFNLLLNFSSIASLSSFSSPNSFLITFSCSISIYFRCCCFTFSSTSRPIFCCSLLNSYSFFNKPNARNSLFGIYESKKYT